MGVHVDTNLVCDVFSPGIRVVRFVRPDLRSHLYDKEAIAECSLYREIEAVALGELTGDDVVVLNFGLIDNFPTAFYRLMLKVRESVLALNARLLLCCFTPNVRECFDLMGGGKLFDIRSSETSAIHAARQPDEARKSRAT